MSHDGDCTIHLWIHYDSWRRRYIHVRFTTVELRMLTMRPRFDTAPARFKPEATRPTPRIVFVMNRVKSGQIGVSVISRFTPSNAHEWPQIHLRCHYEWARFCYGRANVFFCRPLKYLMPHRQTVWTQIRLLLYDCSDQTALVWAVWSGNTLFASLLMLNIHFQMQLICWRFKD